MLSLMLCFILHVKSYDCLFILHSNKTELECFTLCEITNPFLEPFSGDVTVTEGR